jgi:hypothetical protein
MAVIFTKHFTIPVFRNYGQKVTSRPLSTKDLFDIDSRNPLQILDFSVFTLDGFDRIERILKRTFCTKINYYKINCL